MFSGVFELQFKRFNLTKVVRLVFAISYLSNKTVRPIINFNEKTVWLGSYHGGLVSGDP